ncbi:MAG: DUF3244 domain-containing protein [Bacteroidaceae bacterium]|nr:DUF3244 domain-containing protein [Bacteroidaceae bacterium]
MKCRVIISFVMLLFTNNIYCETINSTQYDTDEIIEIKLQDEEKNNNENKGRSLYPTPISCYYSNGYIFINSIEALESIEVRIINLQTNETIYENEDKLSVKIKVSESQGNYFIRITCNDNKSYIGFYTL